MSFKTSISPTQYVAYDIPLYLALPALVVWTHHTLSFKTAMHELLIQGSSELKLQGSTGVVVLLCNQKNAWTLRQEKLHLLQFHCPWEELSDWAVLQSVGTYK